MKRSPRIRAKRVTVDGHNFHSMAEARRYGELKLQQMAGLIRNLELQPEYRIAINGIHCCAYRADFRYFRGEEVVVEDVKGHRTQLYELKKKLVHAAYPGVRIVEVRP